MTSASAPSWWYNDTWTASWPIFSLPTNQLTQWFEALWDIKMHIDSWTEWSGSTSWWNYPVIQIEAYNWSSILATWWVPKSWNYQISNANFNLGNIKNYLSDSTYLRLRAKWNRYWWTIKWYYLYVEIDKVPDWKIVWNPKSVVWLWQIWYIIIFDETSIYDLENRWYVSWDHYSSTAWDITSFYWYVTVTIWWKKYKLPTIWTES